MKKNKYFTIIGPLFGHKFRLNITITIHYWPDRIYGVTRFNKSAVWKITVFKGYGFYFLIYLHIWTIIHSNVFSKLQKLKIGLIKSNPKTFMYLYLATLIADRTTFLFTFLIERLILRQYGQIFSNELFLTWWFESFSYYSIVFLVEQDNHAFCLERIIKKLGFFFHK